MTTTTFERKQIEQAKIAATELEITKLMATTYHFELTFRQNIADRTVVHRANCLFCSKKFLATSIGMPINERMIQHYENHHAKGRLQEASTE